MQEETAEEREIAVLQRNRFETQESAVFLDYSSQSLLKALKDYPSLSIYYRTALSKNIDSIRTLLHPSRPYFDWLLQLAADHDDIQQDLFDYLKALHAKDPSLEHCSKEFIQPLVRMAAGPCIEIKDACCQFLCGVAQCSGSQEKKGLVALIFELEKKASEEGKGAAVGMASRLLNQVDGQQQEKIFDLLYKKVYSQASVRFKKEIVHSCCLLQPGIPAAFIDQKIIDLFFTEKCKEPVWGIRKACVETLPALVALTATRKEALALLLYNFTRDGSKIVRLAAFKTIPEFLANYGSVSVPDNLLELFCSLPGHSINKESNKECEVVERVAFYLPGVLQTVGVGKWERLRGVMEKLMAIKQEEVKMPIACSIHHICRMLGPQLANKAIFQTVNQLLNDHSERINLAVIANFSEIVAVFDQARRESLIDFFLVLQKDPRRWRIRLAVAVQLGSLSKLYNAELNFQYLFPIALRLCNDGLSVIREYAASHMHRIVMRMDSSPELQEMAIKSVVHLASSGVFQQRQTFASMVEGMIQLELFREQVAEVLVQLAKDRVVGVRVALARALRSCRQDWGSYLLSVVQILTQDEQCVSEQLESQQ